MTNADSRWERMRTLFDRVRDLPPAEREGFLRGSCDDAGLRAEVVALLEMDRSLDSGSGTGFLRALDRHHAAALLASVERAEEFAPDEALGRYRVIRPLGRGGMGVVYLAHDPLLDRAVALKVLPAHLSLDEAANRALAAEARAASATDHPGIATVHDVGETSDGRLFIVMPHYPGSTLRDLLAQGPLAAPRAVEIARQVASALAAAHARGIIHRDIKPANLLLAPNGDVKILDFGIATVTRGEGPAGSAQGGTAAYMSPEQVRGDAVDCRSDLWAVGVVLWEMLTGSRPFDGADAAAIRRTVLEDAPRLPGSVPAPLRAVVHRCLEPALERRPDATALLRSLERLDPRAPRHSFARVVLVGAIGTLAAAAAGGLLLRSPAPAEGARTPARAIAVLPFTTVSADTALARVGRELVVTLSATLGGVTDGGVIDPQAVLAADSIGSPARSATDAARLALRLGAGRVLRGTLVRLGRDSMRIEAALVDLAARQPIAHAAASAAVGDLLVLTDSLTLRLVRGLWREGDVPTPSAGGLATSSVEALQHYLDGERAFAAGEFSAAIADFERAFSLDTTFWMAYWRSLYPRVYEGTPPADSAMVRAVTAHRADLPPPDRGLIEAIAEPALSRRLAAGRALTRAHPSYWPGWYEYGNTLVHDGPYVGTGYEQARLAFDAVVRLQPRFTPAWVHLFWIAIYQGDTAAAGGALARVRDLAGPGSYYLVRDDLRYYEALLSILRGGGEDAGMIARDAPYLAHTPLGVGPETLGNSLLEFGFGRAQIAMADAVLALGASHELAVELLLGRGRAWASRGAWDSALVSSRRAARLAGTARAGLAAYAIAAAGAALGGLDTSAATLVRRELEGVIPASPSDSAELHWLDGLAGYARRDTGSIEQARLALGRMPYQHAELLAESLAGLKMAAAGDVAAAGRALAGLEERKAEAYGYAGYAPSHTWLTGMNRLLAARFLVHSGLRDRAALLLTWHEAIRWGATNREEWVNRTLEPLAVFERARIAEARGRRGRAATLYAAFLRQFDRPVESLASLRREAEAGLHRSRSAPGAGEPRHDGIGPRS